MYFMNAVYFFLYQKYYKITQPICKLYDQPIVF
jgi:hypothetical protein